MNFVPNRTTLKMKLAGYGQQEFQAVDNAVNPQLSVVIPIRNGAATIGQCLQALLASRHDSYEIIVVNDGSTDNSVEIIKRYPCRLLELKEHTGAAGARNSGAAQCRGNIIFFTDADCLVQPDTLTKAAQAVSARGDAFIVGGTYTPQAADDNFFSLFQSIFIHYSELKNGVSPDYIATHAMAISAATFFKSGGFSADFLPILEDVEFSHRARRRGYHLQMEPGLMVQHIFNYSLPKSMGNAYLKSRFWTIYSLHNKDLFSDSGTASLELKLNVALYYVLLLLVLLWGFTPQYNPALLLVPVAGTMIVNRKLLRLYYNEGGIKFAVGAGLYYILVYPLAIGAGILSGILNRRQLSIPAAWRKCCEITDTRQ